MAVRLEDLTPAKIRALLNSIQFDLDTGEISEDLRAALKATIQDAGAAGKKRAGSSDPFSIRDKATEDYLIRHAGDKWAKKINATTRQLLRGVFQRALDEGTGLKGIVDGLREAFDDMSDWRANTIARSETAMALNFGSTEGYKQAGIKGVLVLDGDRDDTDESCRAVSGMTISVEVAQKYPIQHPNCFSGEVPAYSGDATAAFSRHYEGEIVIVQTARGRTISVTPNHPILTTLGWVPAGRLQQGLDVLCIPRDFWGSAWSDARDYTEAPIRQIAESFGARGFQVSGRASAEDFHGDAADGDIYVVRTARLFKNNVKTKALEFIEKGLVNLSDVLTCLAFFGQSPKAQILFASSHATDGIMRGLRDPGPQPGISPIDQLHGLTVNSQRQSHSTPRLTKGSRGRSVLRVSRDFIRTFTGKVSRVETFQENRGIPAPRHARGVTFDKSSVDGFDIDSILNGKPGNSLAAFITTDKIRKVHRSQVSTHVYNLETRRGWYLADSIIAHNCVRSFSPLPGEFDDDELEDEDFLEAVK